MWPWVGGFPRSECNTDRGFHCSAVFSRKMQCLEEGCCSNIWQYLAIKERYLEITLWQQKKVVALHTQPVQRGGSSSSTVLRLAAEPQAGASAVVKGREWGAKQERASGETFAITPCFQLPKEISSSVTGLH